MKKYLWILLFVLFCGCTRVPEKLYNPTAIIRAELKDDKTIYTLHIKGIILNESDEKIFKNIEGTISLLSNDQPLTIIPFNVEQLLPFQKYELHAEKTLYEYEIKPILQLLRVSSEQLQVINEPVYTEEIQIYHKLVELNITKYETISIYNILRGIKNEGQ